ncbi:MAG: putative glycosyltransferase [Gemmatimonadetes bacterium]|nr:putative glycosyltransferase [Gemmatimonadota bacterium]
MLSVIVLAQIIGLLVLIVRLFPGRRRPPPVAPILHSSATGEISIIVATLNEAHRIAPCIEGLIAQGPVVGEILFVDSGSTDGTGALIEAAARRDPRIRLLRDDPLPGGWVGKVWALQHGLAHASTPWVLGMDADTIPQPGMAAGVLGAARVNRYAAVSFAPRFRISTAAERWLQPALLVTLVYRFGAAGADSDSERVMANGQCFLARRSTLLGAGGYSSAKASFSDDVTLARHLARRGHRVGFLDGSRLYDVRSYTSAVQAWREWGRSLDLKDSTSRTRQCADVLFLLVVQGTPVPVFLFVAAAGVSGFELLLSTSLALFAVRVMLQFALAASYAERGVAFWLSPLADPLAALRILLSSLRRPRSWRGRSY